MGSHRRLYRFLPGRNKIFNLTLSGTSLSRAVSLPIGGCRSEWARRVLQGDAGTAIVGLAMETLQCLDLAGDRVAAVTQEAALVRDLQAGSQEAFDYLLGVYQNPVFNLVCRMVENPADAADVLQEVFLKVCRGIRFFHGESSLKTWIYKIAVHEASNHRRGWLRRLRREPFSLEDRKGEPVVYSAQSAEQTPYEALEQAEREKLVSVALSSLAPSYRAVVVLREMEGMSYEEIARVIGVPEGTVKSRLMRGREMLRSKLAGLLSSKLESRNSKTALADSKLEIRSSKLQTG